MSRCTFWPKGHPDILEYPVLGSHPEVWDGLGADGDIVKACFYIQLGKNPSGMQVSYYGFTVRNWPDGFSSVGI